MYLYFVHAPAIPCPRTPDPHHANRLCSRTHLRHSQTFCLHLCSRLFPYEKNTSAFCRYAPEARGMSRRLCFCIFPYPPRRSFASNRFRGTDSPRRHRSPRTATARISLSYYSGGAYFAGRGRSIGSRARYCYYLYVHTGLTHYTTPPEHASSRPRTTVHLQQPPSLPTYPPSPPAPPHRLSTYNNGFRTICNRRCCFLCYVMLCNFFFFFRFSICKRG